MTWLEEKKLREKTFTTTQRIPYEEVCKICSTPRKFIKYIQANKDMYYESGEFDKVEPALSYIPDMMFRPIRYIDDDFMEMVGKYIKDILSLGKDNEIELFRGMRLESEYDLDWNDLGNCWSYDYDSAIEFIKYFIDESMGGAHIITAITDRENVDWILSICLNLTHINEKELRLYDSSAVEDPYIEEVDEKDLY